MQLGNITEELIHRINSMYISETIPQYGINVVWVRLIRSAADSSEIFAGPHKHTFCEVHLCLEGQITYTFGDCRVCIQAGEGVAIAPGVEHEYNDSENFTKCAVTFSADPESPFFEELQKIGAVPFRTPQDFGYQLEGILGAIKANDCFSSKLCAGFAFGMVRSILQSIGFTIPKSSDSNSEDYDPRLSVAKKYIQANRNRMLSCDDVARECGLSTKQLGRIFKKYTDQSLASYIKESKLKACEELLLDGRYTVKEIGFELGFENEYYFNSFFKRHYGMPPGLFKKQNAVAKKEED